MEAAMARNCRDPEEPRNWPERATLNERTMLLPICCLHSLKEEVCAKKIQQWEREKERERKIARSGKLAPDTGAENLPALYIFTR